MILSELEAPLTTNKKLSREEMTRVEERVTLGFGGKSRCYAELKQVSSDGTTGAANYLLYVRRN